MLKFQSAIKVLDDRAYLKAKISYGAAPTLFGMKPSNILAVRKDLRNTYKLWNNYGEELCRELTFHYLVLRDTGISAVVLFYNRELLKRCLTEVKNRDYLLGKGYPACRSVENYLGHLKNRFQDAIPHEIGIFLGIPAEDVDGFVKNKGKFSVLKGDWKVYHDPYRAAKLFNDFDKARIKVVEDVISIKKTPDPFSLDRRNGCNGNTFNQRAANSPARQAMY